MPTLDNTGSTGVDPLTGFDKGYYLAHNPDIASAVAATGLDPYAHYLKFGWKEGRNPNAIFNTALYLANNLDIYAASINPLAHYMAFGSKEGRQIDIPTTILAAPDTFYFNTAHYLAVNPDVAAAGANPMVHYIDFGIREGRSI